MDVKHVTTVQIDVATEGRCGCGRRSAIRIQAGRICALAGIAVEVEFDSDTGRNARSSSRRVGAIAQTAASRTERSDACVLDYKSHTVGIGIRQLKAEIGGERLDIERGCGE